MTEAEWLACTDPQLMLQWVGRHRFSQRKLRLFDCAGTRALKWDNGYTDLDLVERLADGLADEKEVDDQTSVLADLMSSFYRHSTGGAVWTSSYEAAALALGMLGERSPDKPSALWEDMKEWNGRILSDVVRELFGNPFAAVDIDPAWLAWNGATVLRMAQAIYHERAFDRLPVLADALEDAGCNNADILSHCRGPGPHVRGCWVVDLLFGRC